MQEHDLFLKKKLERVSFFVKKDSKVLDIGCYNGRLLKFLPKCDYYGIDIDKEKINFLKQKGLNVKQIDLNKQKLPFKKEKFDYIFLLDILEHLTDPGSLLKILKNFLNEQGKIILTLPNDYHFLNKIRFILNKPLTNNSFDPFGHLHIFPIKIADNFLLSQNFKILRKEYLAPTKPILFPTFFKEFLSKKFPQNFSRNTLYILKPKF